MARNSAAERLVASELETLQATLAMTQELLEAAELAKVSRATRHVLHLIQLLSLFFGCRPMGPRVVAAYYSCTTAEASFVKYPCSIKILCPVELAIGVKCQIRLLSLDVLQASEQHGLSDHFCIAAWGSAVRLPRATNNASLYTTCLCSQHPCGAH